MDLAIHPLETAADAAAFRALNEEWIARHFTLEAEDRRQLDDPFGVIVDPGGEILIAELEAAVVGCVAVRPTQDAGVYELSKMAVTPGLRGHGIGRRLLAAAIRSARSRGATSLFLGSSTKLPSAVHLYEAMGFAHIPASQIHMPYARADVFMRLDLGAPLVRAEA